MSPSSVGADPLVISGHLGPGASLLFVGCCLLAFAALVGRAVLTAIRNWRMAAAASASFQPDKPYRSGAIVLHGRVELAQSAAHAVRVEVVQEGTEKEHSGGWTYAWTETSRRVFVEPFYLVDAAGRRTRVEPRNDVLLVDAMDRKGQRGRTRRVCSAELTPGEEVWASGELTPAVDPEGAGGGYRGGTALVLRAPPGQRMLLSSEPLTARFKAKTRFHARWSLILGLVALVACGLCFHEYAYRLLVGETRSATITKLDEHVTETENATTLHHTVYVTVPGEPVGLDDDVPVATFARLKEGQSIPVRWVRARPRLGRLGPDATVNHQAVWGSLLFFWLPAALLYWDRNRRSLVWYEAELIEKGGGRLSQS